MSNLVTSHKTTNNHLLINRKHLPNDYYELIFRVMHSTISPYNPSNYFHLPLYRKTVVETLIISY